MKEVERTIRDLEKDGLVEADIEIKSQRVLFKDGKISIHPKIASIIDTSYTKGDNKSFKGLHFFMALAGGVFAFLFIAAIVVSFYNSKTFMQAVKDDQTGLVKLLTWAGADVNSTDENGATPLMWATYNGDMELVKYLVSKGADFKKKGIIWLDDKEESYYGNLLGIAAGQGNIELVKYFIEELRLDVDDRETVPRKDRIGSFLSDKRDKDDVGWTPLMWAADKGNLELVKYLVSNGADYKTQDKEFGYPAFIAARKEHVEIVEYFISEGFDIDARDEDGRTLLHTAAYNCEKDMVNFLIKEGANLKMETNSGNTALKIAEEENCSGVVELLKDIKEKVSPPQSQHEEKVFNKFGPKGLEVFRLIDGERTSEEIMNKAGVSEGGIIRMLEWMKKEGIVRME